MKKKLIAILLIVVLIAGGAGAYVLSRLHSPEYAVRKTVDDITANGIDALEGHVTAEVWGTVSDVLKVIRNPITQAVTGVVADLTDYDAIAELVEGLKNTKWTLSDTMKGKENASVLLHFESGEKLSGTVRVDLLKQSGKWLINRLYALSFNGISLP